MLIRTFLTLLALTFTVSVAGCDDAVNTAGNGSAGSAATLPQNMVGTWPGDGEHNKLVVEPKETRMYYAADEYERMVITSWQKMSGNVYKGVGEYFDVSPDKAVSRGDAAVYLRTDEGKIEIAYEDFGKPMWGDVTFDWNPE